MDETKINLIPQIIFAFIIYDFIKFGLSLLLFLYNKTI